MKNKEFVLDSRPEIIELLMKKFGEAFLSVEPANAGEFVSACLESCQNVMLDVIIARSPAGRQQHNRTLCETAVLNLYNTVKSTGTNKEIIH